MLLVWLAAMLYSRILEPDDGTPRARFPQAIRLLAAVATIALSIVLITGTMVTGSGVHSGDSGVGMEGRLQVDTEAMAVTHAMCMYVYLTLTVITIFLLYKNRAPQDAKKAGWRNSFGPSNRRRTSTPPQWKIFRKRATNPS